MKRVLTLTIFLFGSFLFCNFSVFAQTDTTFAGTDTNVVDDKPIINAPKPVLNETNAFIINKWEISEYKENGKVQELPNYEIEFFDDGTYSAIEEEEFDNGIWNIGENNSKIIFDDNSVNREEWNIVSMDAKKIVVKFSDEGNNYEYTFIPWVKRQQ